MVGLAAHRELLAAFETVERGHRNFPRKADLKNGGSFAYK
jgi:hypothetical protein